MKLPVLEMDEYHTTEMMCECPRQAYHKLRGEAMPEVTTALYRGALTARTMELYHTAMKMGVTLDIPSMVRECVTDTEDGFAAEERVLSDTVQRDRDELRNEVISLTALYDERFGDRLRACKIIGCELPIRVDVGGFHCASHLDLLIRDTDGVWLRGKDKLIVIDHKWTNSSPTLSFVNRSYQLLMYWLGVATGEVHLTEGQSSLWTEFKQWPECAIIWMPGLKPYWKATTQKDDEGRATQYSRGDARPDHCVVKWGNYQQANRQKITAMIVQRLALMRDGHWPMIPSPERCMLCPSEQWCFDPSTREVGI